MKIRRATLKDLKDIQQLNNELFELELANFDQYLIKNWPLSDEGEKYFTGAINNDFVVVAETNNHVVGYLLGEKCDIPYYNFDVAELCNMCVNSNYRKCGIGAKLYSAFEEYYNSQGITHFVVTASFKNESAKAFYKKMGFEEANTTICKFK